MFDIIERLGYFLKILILEILYFLKVCQIFVRSVYDFRRSNGDII